MITACLTALMMSLAFAQSGDLLERTIELSSNKKTAVEAKKEIQDLVALQFSEEVIKELVGVEKFTKNRQVIKNKITSNSGRYIPFMKAGDLKQNGETFSMAVSLKLSLKDLKTLLQRNSLLSANESAASILPVVTIYDRVRGQESRWWSQNKEAWPASQIQVQRKLEDSLKLSFMKDEFFVHRPMLQNYYLNLPSTLRVTRLDAEEYDLFSEYFDTSIVIEGQVQILNSDKVSGAYRVDIKLSAVQVSNQKVIADVFRRYETERGQQDVVVEKVLSKNLDSVTSDLSGQLLDAWQKGSLGGSQLRLVWQGSWTIPQMENFKERVRAQIPQVRAIRERQVSSQQLVFEVDMVGTASDLGEKIKTLSTPQFAIQVLEVGDQQITLGEVKR